MKLTTKSIYGVRALINLAVAHEKEGLLSISRISKEEGISNIYLEQIFNRLKNHGIIKSIRGPKGGYTFARNPADINVYEIIKILEGSIFPGECAYRQKEVKVCEKAHSCVSKEIWHELDVRIKETLKGFTFKDLAERALNLNPERLMAMDKTSGR